MRCDAPGGPLIYDGALERNRRLAWARFYRARDDARQAAWYAAELAAWVELLVPDDVIPEQLAQLIGIVEAPIEERDLDLIARAVQAQARPAVDAEEPS